MRQKLYPNRKVRTINIDNALWVTFGEVPVGELGERDPESGAWRRIRRRKHE